MKNLWGKIQQVFNFIKKDVWRIRRAELPPVKSFLMKILRALLLAIRGYKEDKCQLRASALTFYSLVSIVPVAAMAFGIAKGFGFEKILEEQLRTKLAGQEEVLAKVIEFSHSLLSNTRGGLIAGIGLVVLLWAVIKVLGQIEYSFNDIWKIKEKRTIGRMFSDYLSLMLVCPVILVLASGVNVFITTQVNMIIEKFTLLGGFSSLIFFLLKLLPFTLMWILFTFLYMFMPNTKVHFSSGLFAGILIGTVFQIVQWAYITFQIGVVHYNAIYGSFAALPLFLAWLQISWLIVLFGVEISLAYQTADDHEFEPDFHDASHRLRILLSLWVTGRLIKNFIRGDKPMTAGELTRQMEIPRPFVDEIIATLVTSKIISAVEINDKNNRGYQPAMDLNTLNIRYVIEVVEKQGMNKIRLMDEPEFKSLSESLEAFGRTIENLQENKLLKEI